MPFFDENVKKHRYLVEFYNPFNEKAESLFTRAYSQKQAERFIIFRMKKYNVGIDNIIRVEAWD